MFRGFDYFMEGVINFARLIHQLNTLVQLHKDNDSFSVNFAKNKNSSAKTQNIMSDRLIYVYS